MPKDEAWKVAKQLLIEDIAAGFVEDAMSSETVRQLRQEYAACLPENFKRNLQALRARIKQQETIADRDKEALIHDRSLFPKEAMGHKYPRWEGSEAARFIKIDIDEGKLGEMKPMELWNS